MKNLLNTATHRLCAQRNIIEEYTYYRNATIEKILEMQICLISIGAPKFSYPFKIKEIPGYIHELRWFHTKNQDETKNWYLTCGYKKEDTEKFIYDKPENMDLLELTAFIQGLSFYFNLSISLIEDWDNKKEINVPIQDDNSSITLL